MIETKLSPCNLTVREIIKAASWYASGKRSTFISEKQLCHYEQVVAGSHPEHLLSVITEHLECVGTMPTADELYEALFNAHNHSQTQKRLVLHIEEARERQRDS